MKIENNSIQGRITRLQETFQKKLAAEKVCQELIDLTLSRPFIRDTETGTIGVDVSHYDWSTPSIIFTVSEVNLSDFIEGVLGVLHRWRGYNWRMTIDGYENDPVFEFSPLQEQKAFDFRFRVKEGTFKSCTIKKTIKRTHHYSSENHEYNYEMECM